MINGKNVRTFFPYCAQNSNVYMFRKCSHFRRKVCRMCPFFCLRPMRTCAQMLTLFARVNNENKCGQMLVKVQVVGVCTHPVPPLPPLPTMPPRVHTCAHMCTMKALRACAEHVQACAGMCRHCVRMCACVSNARAMIIGILLPVSLFASVALVCSDLRRARHHLYQM